MVSANLPATSGRSRKLISFSAPSTFFGSPGQQAVHPVMPPPSARSLPAEYLAWRDCKPCRSIPSRGSLRLPLRDRRDQRVKRCDIGHQLFTRYRRLQSLSGRWCCRNSPAYAPIWNTSRASSVSRLLCILAPQVGPAGDSFRVPNRLAVDAPLLAVAL